MISTVLKKGEVYKGEGKNGGRINVLREIDLGEKKYGVKETNKSKVRTTKAENI